MVAQNEVITLETYADMYNFIEKNSYHGAKLILSLQNLKTKLFESKKVQTTILYSSTVLIVSLHLYLLLSTLFKF